MRCSQCTIYNCLQRIGTTNHEQSCQGVTHCFLRQRAGWPGNIEAAVAGQAVAAKGESECRPQYAPGHLQSGQIEPYMNYKVIRIAGAAALHTLHHRDALVASNPPHSQAVSWAVQPKNATGNHAEECHTHTPAGHDTASSTLPQTCTHGRDHGRDLLSLCWPVPHNAHKPPGPVTVVYPLLHQHQPCWRAIRKLLWQASAQTAARQGTTGTVQPQYTTKARNLVRMYKVSQLQHTQVAHELSCAPTTVNYKDQTPAVIQRPPLHQQQDRHAACTMHEAAHTP